MSINIGIDLMESANLAEDILAKVLSFQNSLKKEMFFTFFATHECKKKLDKILDKRSNAQIVYLKDSIKMDENPLLALRKKKESTIFSALRYLKDDKIDAFISCGNTGAILAGACHILDSLNKKINRPALLAMFPTKKNLCAIIDVGANVNITPDNLKDFSLLAYAYQKAKGLKNPKVGLLNIGQETTKGSEFHKKAYLKLKALDKINFVGNIEANEVFEGKVDVLITDGFTGNIFLKTSEGLTSFVFDKIEKSSKNLKIFNGLKDLKKNLCYGKHPGALLVGVDKVVIKCHGYSSIQGIISAILGSIELIEKNTISLMQSYLG